MIGASIVFLQTSCVIPQIILLYRGRDKVLPPRYFDLGRCGTCINAVSGLWVIFLDIVYFMPVIRPVTWRNMNYVSGVTVAFVTFVLGSWLLTKKASFTGPTINLAKLRKRRELAFLSASQHQGAQVQNNEHTGLLG